MARPKYWDVWRDVRKTVKTVAEQELRHAWKQSELRPLGLRYLDSRFRALPAKVYKKVLAYNTVDRSRYKSEHFDCDIFAVFLAGDVAQRWSVNGIVIDTSAGHAYNCVLTCDDGEIGLQMVESQTDELVDSADRGYSARHHNLYLSAVGNRTYQGLLTWRG